MASRAYETAIEDAKRNLWIIWAAMVVSIPLFGLYGYFITAEELPMDLPLWYQVSLGGAVLLMGSMSVLVPRKMLSNRVLMEHVRAKDRQAFAAPKAPMGGHMQPREERLASLVTVYRKPFVMGLILNEMIVLLGVVYALLSAQPIPMLVILGVAGALFAVNRPAIDELTDRATKYLPEDRAQAPTAWPTQQSEY
jgi:hypothetical protein